MSNPIGGLLVVDKLSGWTSHDVVARTRRLAGTRKVGHAGTLDPMATGVLLLGIGKGTKLLTYLVGCDKDYEATIRLGVGTVSEDADGEVVATPGYGPPDRAALDAAIAALRGELDQIPSAVSAIKVGGRRAYARVRAGEEVTLAPRRVTVSRFEIRDIREGATSGGVPVADLDVSVSVSSGTYVRALARDLGSALGTAGHLRALRRTRVGGFELSESVNLEDCSEGGLPIMPLGPAARRALPVRELTSREAQALGFGQRVESRPDPPSGPIAGLDPDGELVAILDESGPTARPLVVFAPSSS